MKTRGNILKIKRIFFFFFITDWKLKSSQRHITRAYLRYFLQGSVITFIQYIWHVHISFKWNKRKKSPFAKKKQKKKNTWNQLKKKTFDCRNTKQCGLKKQNKNVAGRLQQEAQNKTDVLRNNQMGSKDKMWNVGFLCLGMPMYILSGVQGIWTENKIHQNIFESAFQWEQKRFFSVVSPFTQTQKHFHL